MYNPGQRDGEEGEGRGRGMKAEHTHTKKKRSEMGGIKSQECRERRAPERRRGRFVCAGSHFFFYLRERHARCFMQPRARVSVFVRSS